jgi:hypothetical protein
VKTLSAPPAACRHHHEIAPLYGRERVDIRSNRKPYSPHYGVGAPVDDGDVIPGCTVVPVRGSGVAPGGRWIAERYRPDDLPRGQVNDGQGFPIPVADVELSSHRVQLQPPSIIPAREIPEQRLSLAVKDGNPVHVAARNVQPVDGRVPQRLIRTTHAQAHDRPTKRFADYRQRFIVIRTIRAVPAVRPSLVVHEKERPRQMEAIHRNARRAVYSEHTAIRTVHEPGRRIVVHRANPSVR